MKLMTVGDSITAAGQWQQEFKRLVDAYAGISGPLDVVNVGVSGTETSYWPSRIVGLLDQHQPDMVTFYSGTNDNINTMKPWGEPEQSWSWRFTVEAIHNWQNSTIIVPAFIQFSDVWITPQWLRTSEPTTNDRIYVEYIRHQDWFPGIADFQQIPPTPDYLDGGGIHPLPRGYRAMGRITYDAIHAALGWPACPEPPLCGMWANRIGYPHRPFIPCTCTCGGGT